MWIDHAWIIEICVVKAAVAVFSIATTEKFTVSHWEIDNITAALEVRQTIKLRKGFNFLKIQKFTSPPSATEIRDPLERIRNNLHKSVCIICF